jgi:hypothetical protein
MKEFSAIDWLNEQLRFEGIPIIPKEVLETAKKLELAQRIEDYNSGHTDRSKNIFKLPK